MFPPSYSAIANIYNIEITDENSPKLYGLIRYNHKNKHNITRTSTHIKNNIKSEITGIKNARFYSIEVLTKYECKEYKTRRSTIIQKYQYIVQNGSAVGDVLNTFLQ